MTYVPQQNQCFNIESLVRAQVLLIQTRLTLQHTVLERCELLQLISIPPLLGFPASTIGNFLHYPLFRSEILPPFLHPISALQFIREVYVLEEGAASGAAGLLAPSLARGQKRSPRENGEREREIGDSDKAPDSFLGQVSASDMNETRGYQSRRGKVVDVLTLRIGERLMMKPSKTVPDDICGMALDRAGTCSFM